MTQLCAAYVSARQIAGSWNTKNVLDRLVFRRYIVIFFYLLSLSDFQATQGPSGCFPVWSLNCSDLFVLGGLFDGSLLTDDLLQPLQTDVLGAQVTYARLAAMKQRQGVDVLQLRVANTLVYHQIEQLVRSVVQHLVVLPGWRDGEKMPGSLGWGKWVERWRKGKQGKRKKQSK